MMRQRVAVLTSVLGNTQQDARVLMRDILLQISQHLLNQYDIFPVSLFRYRVGYGRVLDSEHE